MSDEIKIKFNCVFLADILGFTNLTRKNEKQAEETLKTYYSIAAEIHEPYKNSKKIQFSDSIVIGFMDIEEAILFSQSFFKRTFDEEIPIRGAIGIGELTYIPKEIQSLTFGNGLNLSSIVEKHHLKGHTCLLICENNPRNQNIYDRINLEKYEHKDLPSGLLYFLLSWWENSKDVKRRIDDRTHGLSCEDIIYLEQTKENLDYFENKERISGADEW